MISGEETLEDFSNVVVPDSQTEELDREDKDIEESLGPDDREERWAHVLQFKAPPPPPLPPPVLSKKRRAQNDENDGEETDGMLEDLLCDLRQTRDDLIQAREQIAILRKDNARLLKERTLLVENNAALARNRNKLLDGLEGWSTAFETLMSRELTKFREEVKKRKI
jgi:hypothetical protein